MKTKTIVTTTQLFVAEDGTEFISEQACKDYEKSQKEHINKMLREALLTPSRKRKCEHQEELESLGYEIRKDGGWYIYKGENWIEMDYDSYYLRRSYRSLINTSRYVYGKGYVNTLTLIDLKGMLDCQRAGNFNPLAESSVETIKRHLTWRKWSQKQLDAIDDEYQTKIERLKKEWESDKEYYKREVARHNEAIDKMLHRGE